MASATIARGNRLLAVSQKLRHRVGRRGSFLGFLAVLDFVFGYYLVYPPANAPAQNLQLPVQVWATWWIGTGVACMVGMFFIRDRVAYGLAALLNTAWGLRYAYLWYVGTAESWAGMTIWLVFAFIVVVVSGWPEEMRIPPEARRIHAD